MASARGTSKGLGGIQPRKVMESERRKNGWFCPVSAGTGSSSLSWSVEPERERGQHYFPAFVHTAKDHWERLAKKQLYIGSCLNYHLHQGSSNQFLESYRPVGSRQL
jgi:hypothetical protein